MQRRRLEHFRSLPPAELGAVQWPGALGPLSSLWDVRLVRDTPDTADMFLCATPEAPGCSSNEENSKAQFAGMSLESSVSCWLLAQFGGFVVLDSSQEYRAV